MRLANAQSKRALAKRIRKLETPGISRRPDGCWLTAAAVEPTPDLDLVREGS